MLAIGISTLICSSLLAGSSFNFPMIGVARFLEGVGSGFIFPVGLATITQNVKPEKLPFVLIENDENLNKLVMESNKNISIASKDSKGQATSYKTLLNVKILILNDKDEIVDQKMITKNFTYNSDENKFRFKEYQNKIEKNLIREIVEEIIIHLNY